MLCSVQNFGKIRVNICTSGIKGGITVDAAVNLLKQNHYRITKQRLDLIRYLERNSDRYVAVTEVDTHMRRLAPNMSHNTIYRNIKEFAAIGIVETQERKTGTWVKYQCDFTHQHHHHFVCRNCGAVVELTKCPESFFADQLPGCKIETHHVELSGLCAKCAAKN